MKKNIYIAIMLLLSCICFSSCEKESNQSSIKNIITDTWNDNHGITIAIDGKQITLPPNDEIWMWITDILANDIVDNDVTIVEAFSHEVSSFKLYNDKGEYVLCLKLTAPIGSAEGYRGTLISNWNGYDPWHEMEEFIKFDKQIRLHKSNNGWSHNDATSVGVKKMALPPNVCAVKLYQDYDPDIHSIDDFLEEVYFGDKVYELNFSLPALNKIYIPEHTIEYENNTPDYSEYPALLSLANYNKESLVVPEGWVVNIASEALKSLTLNGRAALFDGNSSGYDINCPNLEVLSLNDETRYMDVSLFCPSLKKFELPKELVSLIDVEIYCDIESLTIPEKVKNIYVHNLCDRNADGWCDLKSIYFKPITPPSINSGLKDQFKYGDVTIYVPSESFSEYVYTDFFKGLNVVAYDF